MSMSKKCVCGNERHPQLGCYCEECFFNVAIEGPDGDYIRMEDGTIILHGGEVFESNFVIDRGNGRASFGGVLVGMGF